MGHQKKNELQGYIYYAKFYSRGGWPLGEKFKNYDLGKKDEKVERKTGENCIKTFLVLNSKNVRTLIRRGKNESHRGGKGFLF